MWYLRLLALLLAIPGVSVAAPVLLADYAPRGLTWNATCGGCTITDTRFDITSVSAGSTVRLFGNPDPYDFGLRIAAGALGSFDFNATNAAGMAALSARLTVG